MIITTKYHGATNTRGERISATVRLGGLAPSRVYVSYDYALDVADNHAAAVEKLRESFNGALPRPTSRESTRTGFIYS